MHTGLVAGLGDGSVTFPVGRCDHCGGEVLVYARLEVDAGGRGLVWRCLFCNRELEDGGRSVVHRTMTQLIASAVAMESADMDDGWPPLDFALDAWERDNTDK